MIRAVQYLCALSGLGLTALLAMPGCDPGVDEDAELVAENEDTELVAENEDTELVAEDDLTVVPPPPKHCSVACTNGGASLICNGGGVCICSCSWFGYPKCHC